MKNKTDCCFWEVLRLEHLALAFIAIHWTDTSIVIFYWFDTVSFGENPKDLHSNWEFSSVQTHNTLMHAIVAGLCPLFHIIRQCVLNYASLVDHIHEFHKLPLINHTT